MPRPKPTAEENQKRAERRADLMYFAGAGTIAIGVATIHFPAGRGLVTAGAFVILLPLLEIASSFIKGLRRRGN